MKIITVKDLINKLNDLPENKQVLVSNDEELNEIYWGFEVGVLDNDRIIIFPLSGQNIDQE